MQITLSRALARLAIVAALAACGSPEARTDEEALLDEQATLDEGRLLEFAAEYTAAWSSQDPSRVASFYAEDGSLKINEGEAAVGRAAITADAAGFMTAFPDMVVLMDSLRTGSGGIEYHWTLVGTNTGPGGTGNAVRFSGFEEWTLDEDGLIASSIGHFDEAEYARQLEHGADNPGT